VETDARPLEMNRFFQLLLALAAFATGLWFLYSGYEREVSLAGKTETGLTYLKTGLDGKTRVLTHHWRYGAGLVLILGSTWWLVKGGGKRPGRRRR
jgi:hypothetical protein